ncbi:M28 family peptidase [uncultured Spirosoma sp.]|uniref:M28 family peptidase n=1 Tax=uncultured Spirosoma sp. TaxID=278208 RepID=UPI0025875D87|nr:M28 family peptidase [uncultured Spirosoma sp.]
MQTQLPSLRVMPCFVGRFLWLVLCSLVVDLPTCLSQPVVRGLVVSDSLLRAHVYNLAADSLQGRRTGTIGQRRAAAYCQRALRASHLTPVFKLDSVRTSYRQTFPIVFTNVATFGSLPGNSTSYRQAELADGPLSHQDSSRALFGINLGGLLPGLDLKKEIIVVSAHYDHVGASGGLVYHGADDNASGTAAVLGVAAVFDSLARKGLRSRRTVLFVLFSGEEDGLLGSAYFVAHPPASLTQFVCALNADMVGRVDDDHKRAPDYCYVLTDANGSSLKKTVEQVNAQTVQLTLNQGGYNTDDDPEQFFRRSDQYSFARLGIPVLFFTNGSHSDYHRPTDTAKRIRYDVLRKRATLLFQTVWALANPAP